MLNGQLLDRLEGLWRDQQAPLVDRLRPGLPESAVDELTAPLGIRLPKEARMWWQWHDGAEPDEVAAASRELGPGLVFLPLDEAVALCQQMRGMFKSIWEEEGPEAVDYWWRPTWFPITERRGAIRCDSGVPEDAPTPIYWAYSHDHDAAGLTTPRVDAFATMVGWWIEALESGAWRYSSEASRWERHTELIDTEREQSGLV